MFDHGELWHQRLAPHGRVCSAAEAARRALEARHGEPVFVPESTFTTDDDGAARAQPPSFAACAAYAAEDEVKPITARRMMVGLATATARTSTGGPAPRKQLLPAAMPAAAAPAGEAQGIAAEAPEAAPARARKSTGGKEGARGWADSRGVW